MSSLSVVTRYWGLLCTLSLTDSFPTHTHTQEIEITPIPDNDEFVMAKYEGKYGKIPSTYVEKL